MKSTNHSSTGNHNLNQEDLREAVGATPPCKPAIPPTIRTAARDYENPVDYNHPYPSMAQFADLLALRYDANRTRCAYYRAVVPGRLARRA